MVFQRIVWNSVHILVPLICLLMEPLRCYMLFIHTMSKERTHFFTFQSSSRKAVVKLLFLWISMEFSPASCYNSSNVYKSNKEDHTETRDLSLSDRHQALKMIFRMLYHCSIWKSPRIARMKGCTGPYANFPVFQTWKQERSLEYLWYHLLFPQFSFKGHSVVGAYIPYM